ncbi:MAG: adenylate/guanylate cyclase domain-containing protein [Saprospiraceae bacterium]
MIPFSMMLKKLLSGLLFCSLALSVISQSSDSRYATKPEQIQNALKMAEDSKGSDPNKATEWAQKAYDIANSIGDQNAMARASYINGEAFTSLKSMSKAKAKFERAIAHAETSGDFGLMSNCFDKLISMATRENDMKNLLRYAQMASVQLGKKGNATTGNRAQSSVPDTRFQQLAQENSALSKQNGELRQQLAGYTNNNKSLERENNSIANAKQQAELKQQQAEIQNRDFEEKLSHMSAEKAKALLLVKQKASEKKRIEAEYEKDIAQKDREIKDQELKAEKSRSLQNILIVGIVGALMVMILLFNRFRANKKAKEVLVEKNKLIEKEQQRSEELLLNILPPAIADELKRNGKAKARSVDDVSVLFTDFKNFTSLAERLSPEQLVAELDYCFKGFDYIISQYNIEKIKTIGDAYMCAAGLTPNSGNAIKMVKAATEMQEFLRDYKEMKIAKNEPFFEARIGINTGPVVAGVVGNKKFAYDIWGDTVNLAARMEQNSEADKINISEATYWKVKYDFDCEFRGKLKVKNKGEVEMYFVNAAIT